MIRWTGGIAVFVFLAVGCGNGAGGDTGDTGAETSDAARDGGDGGGAMDTSPGRDTEQPMDAADSGPSDARGDTSATDGRDGAGDGSNGADVRDGGDGETAGGADVPTNDTSTGPDARDVSVGPRFQVVSCSTTTASATVQVGPLYTFDPKKVTINPGEVVQWNWAQSVTLRHNVTADDDKSCPTARPGWFQSRSTAAGGATFCVRFGHTGTWRYQCTVRNHCSLGMKGRVVVQ